MQFVLLLFFLLIYIISKDYLKKERKELEKVGVLENGINHKLLFGLEVRYDIHKINLKSDYFMEGMNEAMKRARYSTNLMLKVPEINYWYFINNNDEIVGVTFLIRQDDKACQIEMSYNEFLKVKYEILKIMKEENFEKAIEKYFEKASKNVKLVSLQFKDMLVKIGADYEEIVGL